MRGPVVFIADAGRNAGLGHISRSSAVAVALHTRGVDTRCYAHGASETFERDGVGWTPHDSGELPVAQGHVLVIDSYGLSDEVLTRAAQSTSIVVMHDFGTPPDGAALVVSASGAPHDGVGRRLGGLAYSALRPGYWGLPAREVAPTVTRVLVTTGSGQFAELGRDVADALAEALPATVVTLVLGPHSSVDRPDRAHVIDSPASLLAPLLTADLVISTAGQTMLEAAAAGTPCVALPVVENQRAQAARLAEVGGVRVADPANADAAVAAALELSQDVGTRRDLSRRAQRAVDGYGALRIAFAVDRLESEW